MSTQADVKSIDTLAFVKAAIASFAHEANQALGEVELEGGRAVDYLTVDRAAYWKAEVRKAGDAVNKAMKDLESCRAFKKVGDNQPACVEEKKALEKARRRLELCEQKEALVRRWKPIIEQQFRETCVRLVHFHDVTDVRCPKALAVVERMLKALDAYRAATAPTAGTAEASGASNVSMARQSDEDAGAPPGTPAAPPAADAGGGGA